MSTQAEGRKRRRPERATWVGHNSWWMQITVNLWVGGTFLLGVVLAPEQAVRTLEERGGWWVNFMSFGSVYFIVLVTLMWFLGSRAKVHERNLCERCIRAVPLDTQRAVERKDFQLQTVHLLDHINTKRRMLTFLGVLLVLLVGSLVVLVSSFFVHVWVWLVAVVVVWLTFPDRRDVPLPDRAAPPPCPVVPVLPG